MHCACRSGVIPVKRHATYALAVQVNVGDVIYIEANSGSVKRVGRCDAYSTEFDLEVCVSARKRSMRCA